MNQFLKRLNKDAVQQQINKFRKNGDGNFNVYFLIGGIPIDMYRKHCPYFVPGVTTITDLLHIESQLYDDLTLALQGQKGWAREMLYEHFGSEFLREAYFHV